MRKFILVFSAAIILALLGWGDRNAAQAAGKGIVKIVTNPGDARIFINGKRKGNSPAKPGQTFAIKLLEGEYVIEAVKNVDEYKEYRGQKKVFVAEDTVQTVDLELKRQLTELGKKKDREDKAEAARKLAEKKKRVAAKIARIVKNIEAGMVKVPGGAFRMGCVSNRECSRREKPVHTVTVSDFYLAKTAVTFNQWDACVDDGGCEHTPNDNGWGRGKRPVIEVSWYDAQEFIAWISKKTGKVYRLPTEAEWEYAARAGSGTKYSWGNKLGRNNANCKGCGSKWDSKMTAPVGSFLANKFGLYDMHGNSWEWVNDWFSEKYYFNSPAKNPKGPRSGQKRVVRGGAWDILPERMRSAKRGSPPPNIRDNNVGFRLAR